MNPVHGERHKTVAETTETTKEKAHEMSQELAGMSSKLLILHDDIDLIADVSGGHVNSITRYFHVVDAKKDQVGVMKHGCKALRLFSLALGMSGQILTRPSMMELTLR
jgi:hypothetical protein